MKLESYVYEGVYRNTLEEVVAAYLNGYSMVNTVVAEGTKIYVPKDYQMYILDNMLIAHILTLDEEVGGYNVYVINGYGDVVLRGMFNDGGIHEYELIETMKQKADSEYMVKLRALLNNGFITKSLGEMYTFDFTRYHNVIDGVIVHRYNFKIGGGANIDKYHLEYVFSKFGVVNMQYGIDTKGDIIGSFELPRVKDYIDYKFMVDKLASYGIR